MSKAKAKFVAAPPAPKRKAPPLPDLTIPLYWVMRGDEYLVREGYGDRIYFTARDQHATVFMPLTANELAEKMAGSKVVLIPAEKRRRSILW